MFFLLNGFNSVISWVYNVFVSLFSYYSFVLFVWVLFLFLLYRVPYCYSLYFFFVFLVVLVFSMFVSLFLSRIGVGINKFFSSFIPVGTPLYICFLVCLAETLSYVIRPVVLIFRPFINISLGCLGAACVGGFCLGSYIWCGLLFVLFFYEVFVALVHWYIVISILSFSVDH